MKKMIVIVMMMFVLAGCETLKSAGEVGVRATATIASYSNLKYHYDDGKIIEFIEQADLTEIETDIILEAMMQVEESQAKLKKFKDDPNMMAQNIALITFEYAKLKTVYVTVRNVVLQHEKEYDMEAWLTFVRFDGAAQSLNSQFESLVEASESNAALMTALRLSDTVLKLMVIM